MAPPLVAIPIITTIGRFAAPYLSKELSKLGINKFVTTYGKDAFTSLNETLAADTPMVKADNVPMVNPSFKAPGVIAPDAEEMEREAEKIREMTKPIGFPADPPIKPDIKTGDTTPPKIDTTEEFPSEEEKLPNIEGFPSDTKQLPVIFEQRDVKKQTEQALEPKVEFGPLTETEKQTAQALMGNQPEFYSRVVKSIKDAKPNKLTKNKWKSFIQGDKQELKFLGLDKFLQGNESITKQELLDFVDQTNFANKLKVVEVPLEDQYDFTTYSIGGAASKRNVEPLLREKEAAEYSMGSDYAEQMSTKPEGYQSVVEQYVFQVDSLSFDEEGRVKELNVGDAETSHFPLKYAKNAIAHARAQVGYFDPDLVEKKLTYEKENDEKKLNNFDKTLVNASRQLENTFIIDEIQSDAIQKLQKKGTIDDYDIVKSENIEEYFKKNNMEYNIEYIPDAQTNAISFPTSSNVRRSIPVQEKNEFYPRYEIFQKDGNKHVESIFSYQYEYSGVQNLTNDQAIKKYLLESGRYGVKGLPITESKKYVELVLNAMIKKAVEKDLDSIGITNGQIQYDRYDAQPIEDKEGLRKFYDEIVFTQLEKIAKKYNVELETVKLPGKSQVKDFIDVGLDEPTEESDSRYIQRRIGRAADAGFVLRKVKYGTLANTIENLNRGNIDGEPLPDDPNVVLPDYASVFTEAGRGAGDNILDTLIEDNPDIENEKDYYMWVKPDSKIDKAISRANAGELMSLASAWDIRDINLEMPIASVIEIPQSMQGTGADYLDYFSTVADGTSNQAENLAEYSFYIKNYFSNKEKIDLQYPHQIIKMKLPKKLQKDILSNPIKLSKAKAQTDRLFA